MNSVFPIRPAVFIAGSLLIVSLTGCSKKSAEAIVVDKEYIAAGEERVTPTPPSSASDPNATVANPPSSPAETDAVSTRPLAGDEIVVEDYVMKKEVRGTSKDPRAYPGMEQWRVAVEMADGGRRFVIRASQKQYEKLKPGDRVKVRYSEGKYTGTVWSAEIVD